MSVNKISAPRGTSDILPDEISDWQKLEDHARKILSIYGYKEIRTPVFEETALFNRSLGQTSDVVKKQLLNLISGKEEGFSLRPEGTASVARAYIEHSLDKKEGISKLFYIGPMFRGERPQKGRLRQFHQIGVEVIGPGTFNPFIDAEVIALSVNFLKGLGWSNPALHINSLGSVRDKEKFSQFLREKLKNDKSHLCEECQDRIERNVFRVLDCKNQKCREIVDRLKLSMDHLAPESLKYFVQVKKSLDDLKISYKEAPKLVRGLDYYTHTVFEITDPSLGSQDALGAGGRYNNLVSELGGPPIDCMGFALGIERVLLAMPTPMNRTDSSLDAYLICLDERFAPKVFEILSRLREAGIASDMNYRFGSVKSQMRQADKSKARYVLIFGEDEEKKGVVSAKNMQTGTQQEIPLRGNDISNLKELLRKAV